MAAAVVRDHNPFDADRDAPQRIVGIEESVRVSGRALDSNRLEANGTVGERRCSIAFSRLAAQ